MKTAEGRDSMVEQQGPSASAMRRRIGRIAGVENVGYQLSAVRDQSSSGGREAGS